MSASDIINVCDVKLLTSATNVSLSVDNHNLTLSEIKNHSGVFSTFTIPEEGSYFEQNKPILPMVSRFIVVPPTAGLELIVKTGTVSREAADHLPLLYQDELYPVNAIPPFNIPTSKLLDTDEGDESRLYPAVIADMSAPLVIRGVRLVKVTTYPVQWDEAKSEYLIHRNISVEVCFTDTEPVNPARIPTRKNRSREFLKFIKHLAINGDQIMHDEVDQEPAYLGHYLIVTHENCLEYAVPFIEWRRKSGYLVDILSLTAEQARDEEFVSEAIQDRYDDYLDRGIDPFDHILLIGDRTQYYTEPDPQWILDAYRDQSVWIHGANHADYVYALLEGDDIYPDAAFSRLPSGSQDLMELAIQKTLIYETEPDMDDPDWITRGGVLSQHWGNDNAGAWHITIHTNVRWAKEVLNRIGYDDITFYENYDWDPEADELGPVVRDLFNDGSNLILGRIQNDYFRNTLRGVRENTVFPVYIAHSGHGEATLDLVFRSGDGDELKGAVATTGGWGVVPTAPTSATWMEMIKGFLHYDLNFGWSRNNAIISIEKYFPNFNCYNRASLYRHVKTDFDAYGDPALRSWIGMPLLVEAEHPESIPPDASLFEVRVMTDGDGDDVEGAQVTLYAPGDIPEADDEAYADYDEMFMLTTTSSADGLATFILEGANLDEGTLYVTVTGRNIRPWLSEAQIANPDAGVEIASYAFTEVDGDGDDDINPGEIFRLALTAVNPGDEDVNDVIGILGSSSPWIEVDDDEDYFGEIAGGEEVEGDEEIEIRISGVAPDGGSRPITSPIIWVEFSDGEQIWKSAIRLTITAPNFEFDRFIGNGIIPLDGEEHELDIRVGNLGGQSASEITAELKSLDNRTLVIRRNAEYPDIESGENERIDGERFLVAGNEQVVPGSKSKMMMIFRTADEFRDTCYFQLQLGEPSENAPQSPDRYGYICLDDTDEDWESAPEYDWTEISRRDRDRDFDGTVCDFDGNSPFNIGEIQTVDLGFTTSFYGVEYNQITICSNGFIAMGEQNVTNFQNWPMDQAIGGGVGMIAPLWDNLRIMNNSDVYYFHDEEDDRFIVEWYKLHNRNGNNRDLTFQVILYDSEIWGLETSDPNILFQYKNVSNQRGAGNWEETIPFASVGISSPDGTTGINYTWNNEYPITSARLENQRAILFTVLPSLVDDSIRDLTVNLRDGWNLMSANIILDPAQYHMNGEDRGPDLSLMFDEFVNFDGEGNHRIILAKNDAGEFWAPGFDDFNQIEFWNYTEGYQLLLSEGSEITWTGQPIPADADIPLEAGWNLISYFPTYQLSASSESEFYVISPIIENVIIAKDGDGDFLLPEFNFSNMAPWQEGRGYQVKTDEEVVLNYPEERDARISVSHRSSAGHWRTPAGTNGNMSVLITNIAGVDQNDGDQIAAFINDEIAGVGDVVNGRCGLAVWGEESVSSQAAVTRGSPSILLKYWDSVNSIDYELKSDKIRVGSGLAYILDSFVVLDVMLTNAIPENYFLIQNFPNPFNAKTTLSYGLPEDSEVSISVIDISGRVVKYLVNEQLNAGSYAVTWDASSIPTGIYLTRMQISNGLDIVRKVALIK